MNRIYGRTILYVVGNSMMAYFDEEPAFMVDLSTGNCLFPSDTVNEYIDRIMAEEEYD